MNAFVYCTVGDRRYKIESIYSIKTLRNTFGIEDCENKIMVVTDDKSEYESIAHLPNLILVVIDSQTVKDWSLDYACYTRCKIKCLEYCFKQFQCDLLFIDTDTLILENINYVFDNIQKGIFYMHTACTSVRKALNIIANKRFQDVNYLTLQRIHFYRYIQENHYLFRGKYAIQDDFVPYNSGVIGIAYKNRDLLSSVLEISDLILQHFQYQCAEEFAFSYIFQNAGCIYKLEDSIFHYPEAKFSRYLAGELLNFFLYDDKQMAKDTFSAYGIDHIKELNLTLSDVPYFVRMLLAYSDKATEDLKLSSLEEVFTYLDKDSDYYKEHNSIKKFKGYYKKMKQIKLKDASIESSSH